MDEDTQEGLETTEPTDKAPEALTREDLQELLAAEREKIRAEIVADLKPKDDEDTKPRDPQTITPYEVSDAWEEMMEDITDDYDDLPKDVRKAIRDELREIAKREGVTPMGIREAGYHKKVALAHVEKAVRRKENRYIPASWEIPQAEPGKTSSPKPAEKPELNPIAYISKTPQGEIDVRQIFTPKELARAEKRLALLGGK